MATREENLKKLNDQLEQMSDDELEKVSGGYLQEYKDDKEKLKQLNIFEQVINFSDLFAAISEKIGHTVSVDTSLISKNKYFIDGESYRRNDFWKFVEDKLSQK